MNEYVVERDGFDGVVHVVHSSRQGGYPGPHQVRPRSHSRGSFPNLPYEGDRECKYSNDPRLPQWEVIKAAPA